MVQLSLALACLLAGADAFAPIPTKVPHHTHEEPDTHEVPHHTHEVPDHTHEVPALSPSPSPPPSAPVVIVPKFSEYNDKCAPSKDDFIMWAPEEKKTGTAKECWESCQQHGLQNTGNPNPVPSHQFFRDNDGVTACICQTSCDCFVAEEDVCNQPLNGITNNAQNGECACERQDFQEDACNAIGCCNFDVVCMSAVGPGPCDLSRRLGEEQPEHTHTTLALTEWEGCTAPPAPKLSVHTGSCQYSYHSKQWQDLAGEENTAEECWASCGKWKATANEGEMVDLVLTLDFRENLAALTTSCTCKADCFCWITVDSYNKYAGYEPGNEYYNLEAGTMTTIAEPNWEPPNNKCT